MWKPFEGAWFAISSFTLKLLAKDFGLSETKAKPKGSGLNI